MTDQHTILKCYYNYSDVYFYNIIFYPVLHVRIISMVKMWNLATTFQKKKKKKTHLKTLAIPRTYLELNVSITETHKKLMITIITRDYNFFVMFVKNTIIPNLWLQGFTF